ncbi:MAG: SH3 domain-containing protein [Alphaproteobacteria bacterium]|nr:SH3 domain-containing protein [Alphaproteobacteria bacterium]
MRKILPILFLFAAPAFAENPSGLPVPRFVSLKSDETNIRTGPGTRYPIQWVFRRAHMPVEVVDEFDLWRKIRDQEGTTGWVHHTMLSGKRYAMIAGKEPRVMRIDSTETSKPLFKVEPEVIGALSECVPGWCRLQVGGRKAWIEKDFLWGVKESELFD